MPPCRGRTRLRRAPPSLGRSARRRRRRRRRPACRGRTSLRRAPPSLGRSARWNKFAARFPLSRPVGRERGKLATNLFYLDRLASSSSFSAPTGREGD
eukprot:4657399-Pyramimonas_sp.AAC.1